MKTGRRAVALVPVVIAVAFAPSMLAIHGSAVRELAQEIPTVPGTHAPRPGVFPPTEPDDTAGFVSIFDGTSLQGWDGDPLYWRVENGEIVGETTPDNPVKLNNFRNILYRRL